MNDRHKIGQTRPRAHKLGLLGVLRDHDLGHRSVERILREQFWLPIFGSGERANPQFFRLEGRSASRAAPFKNND